MNHFFIEYTHLVFNDESMGCPFKGPTWLEDIMFNHVIKFFLEGLTMYMRNRISTMMHQLSSRFEFNVNFFAGIDS